jgi:histidinol-phosphate/aromatic aminotransferase/cobyric acid decarboxylase-like protein
VPAASSRPADLLDAVAVHRPSLVLLDRPSITGEFADAEFVGRLAERAAEWAAVVAVDEAYATYPGPAASSVPLVERHRNLVVLRSMSKGYCCGGLRIGFAVAGTALTARLREAAPPLAANSAGLAVALRLLEQGDVFGPLRDRIAEVKPVVSGALRGLGLRVADGAPFLPWVTATADEAVRKALGSRGLLVKELPGPGGGTLLKVALPLSDERLRVFRTLFDLPEAP